MSTGVTAISLQTKSHQDGLTLVEILVTVVILSVGLLGVAALHLSSLQNGYNSNSRSRAAWLANDIADRMRINAVQARNNPSPYNVGMGARLAGTSTAVVDVNQWQDIIGYQLPGGGGSIQVDPIGSDYRVTISIQWSEHGKNATPTTTMFMQFGI